MSRSYKKNPGFYDRSPFYKRHSNVLVRRHKGEPQNGGWYKKLMCSWNICDHYTRYYPMGKDFSYTRSERLGSFRGWRVDDADWFRKARNK